MLMQWMQYNAVIQSSYTLERPSWIPFRGEALVSRAVLHPLGAIGSALLKESWKVVWNSMTQIGMNTVYVCILYVNVIWGLLFHSQPV